MASDTRRSEEKEPARRPSAMLGTSRRYEGEGKDKGTELARRQRPSAPSAGSGQVPLGRERRCYEGQEERFLPASLPLCLLASLLVRLQISNRNIPNIEFALSLSKCGMYEILIATHSRNVHPKGICGTAARSKGKEKTRREPPGRQRYGSERRRPARERRGPRYESAGKAAATKATQQRPLGFARGKLAAALPAGTRDGDGARRRVTWVTFGSDVGRGSERLRSARLRLRGGSL